MTYICFSELVHYWFIWWFVTCSAPIHYPKNEQGSLNPRNEFRQNSNQKIAILLHENAFEHVVCQMAAPIKRAVNDYMNFEIALVDGL